jgi:NurA-like 5'-3' nuclease
MPIRILMRISEMISKYWTEEEKRKKKKVMRADESRVLVYSLDQEENPKAVPCGP